MNKLINFECNKLIPILWPVLVAAFSVVWAYQSLGVTALSVKSLDWLWGDLAQVYIAWGQYLYDPDVQWLTTTRLSHPLPMSVSLFDPMPLLLLLTRPFAGFLGEGHQFFGLYFVFCLISQGIFGYFATLRALNLIYEDDSGYSRYIAAIAGILFASMPYTFYRFQGHTALSSQWVLVLAIWASLATLKSDWRRWAAVNGSVLLIATGLNVYLAFMVMVNFSVFVVFQKHSSGLRAAFMRLTFLVLVAAAGLSVFGFMSAAGAPTEGYGLFSMNMLGPLDSNGNSGILGLSIEDPTGGQSFEGYTYIGLGILLLSCFALLSGFKRRGRAHDFPFGKAIAVLAISYLLALSTTITLAAHTWQMPLPMLDYVMSRFRGSGRLFWIGGFWLTQIAIIALVLRLGARQAATVLTFILIIQLIDVRPIALYVRNSIEHFDALRLQGISHSGANSVLVYPPWQCDHQGTPGGGRNYELVGYFALDNRLPTNNFYAARTTSVQSAYHCDYRARLQQPDKKAIYLLSPSLFKVYGNIFVNNFDCSLLTQVESSIDDFWVCLPHVRE
jgi:hypothetical protein